MADFEAARQDLNEAREARRRAEREAAAASERRRRLAGEQARLQRQAGDRGAAAALGRLEAGLAELDRRIAGLRDEVAGAGRAEAERLGRFAALADPTEQLARLDNHHPILLLPLRLETRFKRVGGGADARDELWVRVFPDDILVDSFEPALSDDERRNTRQHWIDVWSAPGDPAARKSAFRALARSHGAGRAQWLLENYAPSNPGDKPGVLANSVLLLIASEAPLPVAEKPPLAAYWEAAWRAGADAAALAAARATLVAALGEARSAELLRDYLPADLSPRPELTNPTLRVVFLELSPAPGLESQQQAWARAATAPALPERLVLLGFVAGKQVLSQVGEAIAADLAVGPNPSAPPEAQIRIENDDLVVPEPLRWLTDFDAAVAKGMGFRVRLTPDQARQGFDRLFVLGVRLGQDLDQSRGELERLIRHHQDTRKGFQFLPQGTPTNNVEGADAGYDWRGDPDALFEQRFAGTLFEDPDDWRTRRDGRWFAELLGLPPALLQRSTGYFGSDQAEARALHRALWPATLGSFMQDDMASVFGEGAVEQARHFFNKHVLGRGTLPLFRIGAQPYGVLPIAPLQRLGWLRGALFERRERAGSFAFLGGLYALLKKLDGLWTQFAADAAQVGKPGQDPHQALLDVVGLHPTSVEYHQRWAETLEHVYNRLKLSSAWPAFIDWSLGHPLQSGVELLRDLGYESAEGGVPEALKRYYFGDTNLLQGPIVDDRPLSEAEPIRAYRDDGQNYIEWLIAAARDSHDTLRLQAGFSGGRPPKALLYLLLHRAIDAGYIEVALDLQVRAQMMTREAARKARKLSPFLQVEAAAAGSTPNENNPWSSLYRPAPAITANATLELGRYVPQILVTTNPYLQEQLEALEQLRRVPTARLERALAEHVDCLSYRLDAWWLGLLGVQQELMQDEGERGCYLGAYGWLEAVQPEGKVLTPAELTDALKSVFQRPGDLALERDSGNQGYLHAPSLNHAVAAAVLRNGYIANATPANPGALAVNLTSARVRQALALIEGVRNGQSLGALLGYRFERSLHDAGLELDSLIYDFRRKFPLVADHITTTQVPDAPIEALEARNVVDGLALAQHILGRPAAERSYPFGLAGMPPLADPERTAVDKAAARTLDVSDAVADLVLAESVFQVVQGNYDRAAGTLDAYSKGGFPPIPEVVQTPRSGVILTHRVGLQLPAGLDPAAAVNSAPRAKGEPAIQAWLAGLLPPPDDIACTVELHDPLTGATTMHAVTQQDLELQAVDLLYWLDATEAAAMTALDDRIRWFLQGDLTPRPDATLQIRYRSAPAGKISFFALAALLRALRGLLLRSRPLQATDTRLPNEAADAEDAARVVRPEKVAAVEAALATAAAPFAAFVDGLEALLATADDAALAEAAVDAFDQLVLDYAALAVPLARFGLAGASIGFAFDARRGVFAALQQLLAERLADWTDRLEAFDRAILDYAALPVATPAGERLTLLLNAARRISTATPVAPPADPDSFRDELLATARPAFATAQSQLEALRARDTATGLYRALEAFDATPFVLQALDLAPQRGAIVGALRQLRDAALALRQDLERRQAAATALVASTAAGTPAQRIEELTRAAKLLLGEAFVILPEFALAPAHRAEWAAGLAGEAALLQHLDDEHGIDFPLEQWLAGVARVREPMKHLENAAALLEALAGKGLPLRPVQFPLRPADAWLGLEFPSKKPGTAEPFAVEEDKLLYTASYPAGFDVAAPWHCGLLLDEWVEQVPAAEETTGLAFHHDRPNSEPPQSLLLALPADITGSWSWQDLVDDLHAALDLAKQRAVEPQQVGASSLARLLPIIASQAARWPVAPLLNFAFNNDMLLSPGG